MLSTCAGSAGPKTARERMDTAIDPQSCSNKHLRGGSFFLRRHFATRNISARVLDQQDHPLDHEIPPPDLAANYSKWFKHHSPGRVPRRPRGIPVDDRRYYSDRPPKLVPALHGAGLSNQPQPRHSASPAYSRLFTLNLCSEATTVYVRFCPSIQPNTPFLMRSCSAFWAVPATGCLLSGRRRF